MHTFWKRITQKPRLNPTVDRLIRYTYLVILAQAASITLSSCESANSLVAPLGPTTDSVLKPVSESASRALNVVGAITGTQASDGSFVTTFRVAIVDHPGVRPKDEPRIERNAQLNEGSPVVVFLNGPNGDIALSREEKEDNGGPTFTATENGYVSGIYRMSTVGYDGVLVVANITAPDVHTITSPSPGDVVKANKPLKVTWNRGAAADGVVVETLDFTSKYKNTDNGQFTIASPNNPPRSDQVIRVTRLNRQVVTKGKTKSEVVAEFSTSVDGITVE